VEASALDRGKIAFLPQTKDEFYKLANNKGGKLSSRDVLLYVVKYCTVSLPQVRVQEVKCMAVLYFTHGLFLT
jgi:hypothetical protein